MRRLMGTIFVENQFLTRMGRAFRLKYLKNHTGCLLERKMLASLAFILKANLYVGDKTSNHHGVFSSFQISHNLWAISYHKPSVSIFNVFLYVYSISIVNPKLRHTYKIMTIRKLTFSVKNIKTVQIWRKGLQDLQFLL